MILRACAFLYFLTLARGYFLNMEECLNYTIYPVNYELTITPNIFHNSYSYYDCDLVITIIANSPNVIFIELDAHEMDIMENIQVIDANTNRDIINHVRPYEYITQKSLLKIFLDEYLMKTSQNNIHQYYVRIKFRKHVKYDETAGVFLVGHDQKGNYEKDVLVTRPSPHKAKHFFPCFNNLQFESGFKFRVRLVNGTDDYRASLVMADEQRRYTESKKTTIIDYAPSPQISVHQVGFHLSDYQSIQTTSTRTNDTLIIWAPKNNLRYHTFILNFGKNIIDIIHDYSKINRPIVNGVINIVSVPKILDGYEIDSWNLLTIGENRLSNNAQQMSIKQKERMTFELTQQLTRMWLGNPGEPEQRTRWKEQWFKEGVATYLAYYFLAKYHNVPFDTYMIKVKHDAMNKDWFPSTPALGTFNKTLAVEIPERYKELVAWKTASILWMLENWVGSEKFHRALVNYINSRRGKINHHFTLEDFTRQLDLDTVECQELFLNGKTSSNVLNSWFNHHGYPIVDVTVLRNRPQNAIQLKQRHFSFTTKQEPSNFLIPISYVPQHLTNCYNCYRPRFTISSSYSFMENLDGGWILLNANASGYYRVNYDSDTWKLIAKTLQQNHEMIAPLNRAQIVNDVFAIYTAGDMSYELALEILRFLEKERSQIVWQSAIDGFKLLKTRGALCQMNHVLYEEWKSFMTKCVGPLHDAIVYSSDEKSRMFRSIIRELACSVEYQPCLIRVNAILTGYLKGTNVLHPDLREVCYYYSAAHTSQNINVETSNVFDQEDKAAVIHYLQDYKRFINHIPRYDTRPKNMIQISTTSSPMPSSTIVAASLEPNSASQSLATLSLILTSILYTLLI